MKLQHKTLIYLSGSLWLIVGAFLLFKGLSYIVAAVESGRSFPYLDACAAFTGGKEKAALSLISCALFVGFLKGKFVLRKTAGRVVKRIVSFPPPVRLQNVYGPSYYLLLLSMMVLGMTLKGFHLGEDLHGAIDVAIGGALLFGSLHYFKSPLIICGRKSP